MSMGGVDLPTSRNVLFGLHFRAIAAAGPIAGSIAAQISGDGHLCCPG